jgi:ketosteroid isomerase-like protein
MDDLAARIDRIESTLAIQQLPVRYAMAVDSRDVDTWVSLFIEDVNCGKQGKGRETLRGIIEPAFRTFYRSQHFLCGHRIEFVDADHATGHVYCRAEHEDGDNWVVVALCYFDTYERRDGAWYFARRRDRHWYASDMLSHPAGPDFKDWPDRDAPLQNSTLPGEFPTWRKFWDRTGKDAEAAVTKHPA